MLGVLHLHGQVLPVIELAGLLGVAQEDRPLRIVIAEDGGRVAGLAVDSVSGVELLPETSEDVASPHLHGAALVDGVLVGAIDVAAVFDTVQRGRATMSAVDAEVLDVFRAEANERLDRMVELLVAIEDGSAPADAIDLLFRDVHSIKGSAGMVGYDETRSDRPRARGPARRGAHRRHARRRHDRGAAAG